ncbi:hypothetical protein GCM10014715_81580 [Streptomyces spiralis]|uniref:Uncharacterized protein n=1 Tax=Streptomyces spiralis TaxID=66376 RepID=A0A919AL80_9ACTN|nr:hypothetical protein [Streptomyces spiralis]GHF13678.1 hypothetical protein GCM10014715_81580 [Streptomyces spiralis]
MRDDLRTLAALGIDPASLDPAPDGPLRHPSSRARIHPLSPDHKRCSSCAAPAVATCRLDLPGFGLRWLDSCRDRMIAGFELEQP